MSIDATLSYIQPAPTESIIYSCLAVYGRNRRTRQLPGPWFVAVLENLGRDPAAVRQCLFRMVRTHQLAVRKVGRTNHYRLSPYGEVAVETGSRKLLEPRDGSWDGRWSLVSYSYSSGQRAERDRVRTLLELHGFAALGRGLYLHPRDLTEPLLRTLTRLKLLDQVTLFRADRTGPTNDTTFVAGLWNLKDLNQRYRRFLSEFAKMRRRRSLYRSPRDAFRVRLALILAYLSVAWDDPELPDSLLPRDWKGHQAQQLVQQFYEDLLPRTMEYMESVLQDCSN